MKLLSGFIAGLIGTGLAIYADYRLGKYLWGLVPETEWAGLIQVGIVIALIFLTAGVVLIPVFLGVAIGSALER